MKHVIIGTAGHIDHGKSALVEALTGTNPDRLEEEKRRGITIDLGFAFLDLDDVRVGFVDVPGHERFVKNMLAGVGGIDLVLLAIAADESIKPQTREHFDICRLLDIPRGLVVLTKSDLVESEALELVRLEAEEFLRGSFLEGAPVVPASARTGAGLDRVREEILRIARQAPPRDTSRYFRLPIDRAFAVKGFGCVVTGTLVAGSVGANDEAELFPARRRVRLRGVQSGGQTAERAVAGQRTAINLAGVALEDVTRGMVLATPGHFEPTRQLDARVTLLPSARKLKQRARVHFHQGTTETVAEVVLLEVDELRPGASAFAQLRLAAPVLVLPGDRFILRQFSPVVTIGGGEVLLNLAPRHRRSDAGVIPLLEAMASRERNEILARLLDGTAAGLTLAQIIARTGWTEVEVRATSQALQQAGAVRIIGREPLTLASSGVVKQLVARVRDAVEAFHRANPLAEGAPKEDLRGRVARNAGPEVFRAALDELVAIRAIEITGDTVKRAGRSIALQPEEARAREQIERAFAEAGLSVPPLKDVLAKLPVEHARAQKLLAMLLREQVLVKVTEDLVFHRAALAALREKLAQYKQQKGERINVGAFKELTGITRKYAIPLLEYLDRERVTRRAGDERVIL